MRVVSITLAAIVLATASMSALDCSYAVSGCGCPAGTTATLSTSVAGNVVTVTLTVGTQTETKTFFKTESTAICLTGPCGDNTKKLCATSVAGKTWGTVAACSDVGVACS